MDDGQLDVQCTEVTLADHINSNILHPYCVPYFCFENLLHPVYSFIHFCCGSHRCQMVQFLDADVEMLEWGGINKVYVTKLA